VADVADVAVLGSEDTVRCVNDGFDFRPYFTDGACPLCGWSPDAVEVAQPWTHRADWVLIAFAALLVVSVAMTVAVLTA